MEAGKDICIINRKRLSVVSFCLINFPFPQEHEEKLEEMRRRVKQEMEARQKLEEEFKKLEADLETLKPSADQ